MESSRVAHLQTDKLGGGAFLTGVGEQTIDISCQWPNMG
jgi:hypothetical protein